MVTGCKVFCCNRSMICLILGSLLRGQSICTTQLTCSQDDSNPGSFPLVLLPCLGSSGSSWSGMGCTPVCARVNVGFASCL
jgi:hypothetical protein